eukprot:365867-Chlamydomonas_euryale.AAC.5
MNSEEDVSRQSSPVVNSLISLQICRLRSSVDVLRPERQLMDKVLLFTPEPASTLGDRPGNDAAGRLCRTQQHAGQRPAAAAAAPPAPASASRPPSQLIISEGRKETQEAGSLLRGRRMLAACAGWRVDGGGKVGMPPVAGSGRDCHATAAERRLPPPSPSPSPPSPCRRHRSDRRFRRPRRGLGRGEKAGAVPDAVLSIPNGKCQPPCPLGPPPSALRPGRGGATGLGAAPARALARTARPGLAAHTPSAFLRSPSPPRMRRPPSSAPVPAAHAPSAFFRARPPEHARSAFLRARSRRAAAAHVHALYRASRWGRASEHGVPASGGRRAKSWTASASAHVVHLALSRLAPKPPHLPRPRLPPPFARQRPTTAVKVICLREAAWDSAREDACVLRCRRAHTFVCSDATMPTHVRALMPSCPNTCVL